MVELHRAALVPTVLDMFVRVSPGLPGEDLVHIRGLTIVLRGRVVAVVVNGDSARGRVKVVGEGHIGCLTRWPAYGEAGICAAVRPHVGALAGQDRDAGFVDAYRNVCGCCRRREVQWIREGYGRRRGRGGGCWCRRWRRCGRRPGGGDLGIGGVYLNFQRPASGTAAGGGTQNPRLEAVAGRAGRANAAEREGLEAGAGLAGGGGPDGGRPAVRGYSHQLGLVATNVAAGGGDVQFDDVGPSPPVGGVVWRGIGREGEAHLVAHAAGDYAANGGGNAGGCQELMAARPRRRRAAAGRVPLDVNGTHAWRWCRGGRRRDGRNRRGRDGRGGRRS